MKCDWLLSFFLSTKATKRLHVEREERQLRNLIHCVLGVDVFLVINSRFPMNDRRAVGI